jgi:carbamate kinase
VGLVSAAQARALTQMGHFAPGSMRPKMEAAARFAGRAGRRAVICDPAGLESALRGESGTTVIPDG